MIFVNKKYASAVVIANPANSRQIITHKRNEKRTDTANDIGIKASNLLY